MIIHKIHYPTAYYWTTFWQIWSISFILTQFSTFLPPECSGLFPKHVIHSWIILFHWNLCMGCYASVEQVLGPPFDKMSHLVTARQVFRIQSPTTRQRQARNACEASDTIISTIINVNRYSNKCIHLTVVVNIGRILVVKLARRNRCVV